MPGLFDPIEIGTLRLKNRIVMPPMATGLAIIRGEVTEALIRHYTRRARGPGLIVVEHSYVTRGGRLQERQLGIYDDELMPGLTRLTEAVHGHGTPIAIQLNHAGGRTTSEVCGVQPVAPSPVTLSTERSRELTLDEIDGLVEAFGQGARRAVGAGFDVVEVHGAHGFLLNQFLSPLANQRDDPYGGVLENRARLPIRVVKRVREVEGEGFPLFYRLGADDMTPGGLTLEDGKAAAVMLVEAGVDVVDVSSGFVGSRPAGFEGQGYLIPLAEGIKGVVDVPVIGVGGITRAEYADMIVREGRVDLVAVGRALLADPEWAIKAARALGAIGL